jgi:hypothetical protein
VVEAVAVYRALELHLEVVVLVLLDSQVLKQKEPMELLTQAAVAVAGLIT